MNHINRYGLLRLQFLKARKPHLLADIEKHQQLENHLMDLQYQVEMELGQLIFAGLEDDWAEQYVLREFIYS
jgi:hypothetical protein